MRAKRNSYTKEFKLKALKTAESMGVSRAAEKLGIHESMLHSWRHALAQEGSDAFRGKGRRTKSDEATRKIRQQVHMLRQECAILKDVARTLRNQTQG